MLKSSGSRGVPSTSRLTPLLLPVAFAILAVAIGAVTWRFYVTQREVFDRALDAQLTTTADAKVRQLEEWRRERMGQAKVIASGIFPTSAVHNVIAGRASALERQALEERLQAICVNLRYAGAILVDLHGNPVMWEGRRFGNAAHLKGVMDMVLRSGDVVERDFDLAELPNQPHLGLNIPLRAGPGQPIIAGLLLSIDPEAYMAPFLEWPVPSRSAEILLLRREGGSVLFLTATRNASAGPLRQRVELSRQDTVEVMAATGRLGTVRAVDYRGVPVYAALKPVPGTPWLLIAKIDEQEAAETLRHRTLMLAMTAVSLILTSGALLLFLWRREQLKQYRAQCEVEAVNIGDRKRAERELSESESRFRQVVENSPHAIVVVDAETVLYANPEAIRLFGAARESDLTGSSLLDRVAPEQRPEVEQRVRDTLAGLPLTQVERHYQTLNGAHFWAAVTATRTIHDGRPATLLFIRDITAGKAAEEEHQRLEEQLRHAVKMESVGRLAGGVAHDFNNYLTVINGYCDMLLAGTVEDPEIRDSLREIRAAGERAASVTRQLLTFSRKQLASVSAIDLNQVVTDSDPLLRRLIREDLTLTTRLYPGPVTVLADPIQLGQVLMNLVANARDAMPSSGSIVIGTALQELPAGGGTPAGAAPGTYAVLSVMDTGTGISAEIQARIFEPFFTTKGVGAGTGLGLSTAYGIARHAGGWIDVHSTPGEGARFEVWLPRAQAESNPQAGAQPTRSALNGDETLLVVEDQADVRRMTLSMLRSKGYRLLDAANADEALKISAAHDGRIDLLITDVIMPGLNGRQLADRMLQQRPELKILYMSGYVSSVISLDGSGEPDVEYLRKPFSGIELSTKIREVLEGATAQPRRILVIDDDPAVRGLLHHILQNAGHTVLQAADGKAGMAELERNPVDLVITDLVMPEREGLDVLRMLHVHRPELPVIAISGAFGGSFLKIARHLGAAATLAKPVDAAVLLRAVRVVMSSREGEKDSPSQT
ncbi:MAG: response regulator [Candidatus Solibacter sp.]